MKFIYSFLLLYFVVSCQKKNVDEDSLIPEKTILNISYGTDPLQQLDLYLPKNRSADSTPIVILVHGGGWNSGSRNEFSGYINTFRSRLPNWAYANIDYRLATGNNLFPTQEMDVKKAVEYLVQKSVEYGFSSNKIVMMGASAGGHLALLQAYKYNDPEIIGVIDLFGPTDLVTMYNNPWHPLVTSTLQSVTGTTPSQNLSLYQASSPINYVSSASPPTQIFHGELDQVVAISQSKLLKAALDSVGVSNQLVIYPNGQHGWTGSTLEHTFGKMVEFLKSVE